MKKLLSFLLITAFTLLSNAGFSDYIYANHLVGGELSYQCVGDDTYILNLVIYRDCNCIDCADFDNPANITIFNSSGSVVNNIQMFSPTIIEVPLDTEGLCLESSPDVCVERGEYSLDVNLPSIPGGYQVVYQRCCRNNTIVNIVGPGDTGSTYLVNIPENDGGCNNSSPTFDNYPPIIICANSPFEFNHAATDIDGDELVYEICEPTIGADPFDPAPVPASPPPYPSVTWASPYTATSPLGGTPAIEIDPSTGFLTAFPTSVGQFVVGICVSEFRDGELIGTSIRDFQFNVTDCEIVLVSAAIEAEDDFICPGESVQLVSDIFGDASIIEWSPDDGTISDIFSPNPIVTPLTTTTYTIFAANPFVGCSDTDTITVVVSDDIFADAGPDLLLCADEEAILGGSSFGDVFSWSPTDGLDNPNIANPVVTPTVPEIIYTLTVTDESGDCIFTDAVTVSLQDEIIADAGEDQVFCPGEALVIGGISTGELFSWSPIDGLNDPNIANPTATPSETTTYVLTVSNAEGDCAETDEVVVTVGGIADAGIMPTDALFLCNDQESDVAASDFILDEGDVLGYVLHTEAGEALGTVLAINPDNGSFSLSDSEDIIPYVTYYISSVAGPEGDIAGFPDLENPCLDVAPGTPIIFFAPIVLEIDSYCDWSTGEYFVSFTVTGGYPEYDPTANYALTGDFFGDVLFGENITIIFPEGSTNVYCLNVSDDIFGCTGVDFCSEPFECIKTPIELLRFTAEAQENGNLIGWTTASELNNDYFEVQRLNDQLQTPAFETIVTIDGAGNSIVQLNYEYLDVSAPNGISYYRLKQVDFNGQSSTSDVISVTRTNNVLANNTVSIVPNLVRELVNIGVGDGFNQLSIFDLNGKLLHTQAINNEQLITIELTNWQAGLYLVQATGQQASVTAKFVKE